MTTLKKDFDLRKNWYSNRSSCVFPLDLKKGSEFCLSFFNYWKQKNNIDDLKMNLRFYNERGQLKKIFSDYIISDHNEFFFREIVGNNFKGIVDVEFISTKNLRYSFPGITGFYISPKKDVSGVHAAGRILSSNELLSNKNEYIEETNFSLKYKRNQITPFFSLYNSHIPKKNNLVTVKILDDKKNIISKTKINFLKKSYENKIFYLKDFFTDKSLAKAKICIVKVKNNELFTRMVCGNYHVKNHHYEVTHSYPVQKTDGDYISKSYLKKNVKHVSYLPFVKPKELNLKLRVFPTNLKSNLNASLFIFNKSLKIFENKGLFKIKPHKNFFEFDLKNKDEEFGFFGIKQNNVPSRITTNFIYGNGNKNGYDTDIALGFKSIEYPNKFTHCGSFLSSKNTETVILIRKIHYFKNKKNSDGYLNFYGKNFKKKIKISLNKDDYKIVYFSKFHKNTNSDLTGFSWMLNCNNAEGIEVFWNTFNKNFVSGCHSF